MKNLLKQKLASGQTTYGLLVTLGSTELTEVLCTVGLDWLWIDLEHSALSLESGQTLMQVMQFSEVTPVVRIQWNDAAIVKRVLDIGAHAVVFPMVSTAEEAEAAVYASKYPPEGMRGVGGARAQRLGLDGEQYRATANDETMVIVQCETVEAVENIEAIVAVPGVDILFLGPYDLSMSMGIGGEFEHPDFLAVVDKVLAACAAAQMPAGILALGADDVARRQQQGFRFIAMGVDTTIYSQAVEEFVRRGLAHGSRRTDKD